MHKFGRNRGKGGSISGDAEGLRTATGALLLLFPTGKRPDARAIREALAALPRVSVVHELGASGAGEPLGLELLVDGLTFDLVGLAPGNGAAIPVHRHSFGISGEIASTPLEALALQPGPHVSAGGRSLVIVRALVGLAADMAPHLPSLAALSWPPAAAMIGPEFFASTIRSWLDGGPFPALGLTAFAPGEGGALRSEGLGWFIRREIAIEPALAADRAAATRLGMRLVNHLIESGCPETATTVIGEDGETLRLEPGGDAISVRRG